MGDIDIHKISGKVAVITGGAGHIATQYCQLFARLGGRCVLVDRDQEPMDTVIAGLPKVTAGEHLRYVVDLADNSQIDSFVDAITDELGAFDVLVNNAAFTGDTNMSGWVSDFDDQSLDAWNAAMSVNLTAVFLLCQRLRPLLTKGQSPCILNIASIYGVLGPDMSLYEDLEMGNPAAYAASKGGLVQLSRWLATVLSPNIRVNCISAGGIVRGQDPKFVNRYNARVPLGRMGVESDIAKAMLFMTSDLSSYVAGQNLMVDGGFSSW